MGMKFVGAQVERREDDALLRGQGWFTDDIVAENAAVATIVRSQHAHAKIARIDLSAAKRVPGVIGAWAAADLPAPLRGKDLPIYVPTAAIQQLHACVPLAGDEAHYVGQPLAVIVAESRAIAEDAADLVVVDYQPLPPVTSLDQAIAPGAPTAYSSAKDNIASRFVVDYGDIGSAFASPAVTVTGEFRVHRGVCHAMECRAVLADFNRATGKLTLWSATQTPHLIKKMLVDTLELTEETVRVIAPDVGGGFGPKGAIYPEEALMPALAQALGRPVRWTEDRREHFVATTQERDQIWRVEMAADTEGRLLGVRGSLAHDTGAHVPHGVISPLISATTFPGPYVLPAYRMETIVVYTSKPPVTPLRGAGRPQAVFVMERMLDRLARKIGVDRAEIRRRNLVQPQQMPYRVGLKFRDGSPVIYDSGDYPRCQAEVLAKIGYDDFRRRQDAARKEGRYLGLGLANYVEGTGLGPYETSTASVLPNGRIAIASGASPQGQGHKTTLAQIAADALEVDVSEIDVTVGDTDAVRYGMNTFASRTAVVAGSSVKNAATRLRAKILAVAAHILEEPADSLTIDARAVTTTRPSNKKIPLAQLRRLAMGFPGINVPQSFEPGLYIQEVFKPTQAAYANGSHAVEVEVDPALGKVTIQRYCVAHDCGAILNPLIVDGQIQGGVAHGVGNALFELMRYDNDGQPITTTLADYMLPMAPDVPDVEIIHIESRSPNNPLGVKGAGEGGTIPAAAAIISAIENALEPFGVEISESPVLPARLCELIDQRR